MLMAVELLVEKVADVNARSHFQNDPFVLGRVERDCETAARESS